MMERAQSIIKKIGSHDNIGGFTSLGLDCFTGAAQIFSPHELDLDGKTLSTKNIIAIGARPIIPPVSGMDQRIKRRAISSVTRKADTSEKSNQILYGKTELLFFCLVDFYRISLLKMTYCAPMLLPSYKKIGRVAMERTDLIDRINAIFCEVFDDDSLVITPEMKAGDIEEWDSLSHIRLIVAHEIKFGVKFKTKELKDLKNVGNFIDLLKSKLA